MRKIKFRAWITYGYTEEDLENPDMVEEIKETGLGFIDTPNLIDLSDERIKYDCDWYDSDRFTLMQYTGLKDKNGKEIYEGDILKGIFEYTEIDGTPQTDISIGVVKFYENLCCFMVDSLNVESEELIKWIQESVYVIGNIYENPELMKEGKDEKK